MSRISIASTMLVLAMATLVACGGSDVGEFESTPTSVASAPVDRPLAPVTPITSFSTTTAAPTSGEVPNAFVAEIVADASRRSGATIDEMSVALAEVVQWNDGSLGCPEPGAVYTQAIVDGFRIIVESPNEEFDYRTSGTDFFIVCVGGIGS